MPVQPYFFSEGFAPRYNDTLWRRWQKILGEIQSQPGSNPANDCVRTDPIRIVKYKVLRALDNGVCDPVPLALFSSGIGPDNFTLNWTSSSDPVGGFVVRWGTAYGVYPNSSPVAATERSLGLGGLDSDTTYYLIVEAANSGCTSTSAPIAITTLS